MTYYKKFYIKKVSFFKNFNKNAVYRNFTFYKLFRFLVSKLKFEITDFIIYYFIIITYTYFHNVLH